MITKLLKIKYYLNIIFIVLLISSCDLNPPDIPTNFTGWYKGRAITLTTSHPSVFLLNGITNSKLFIYHSNNGYQFQIVKTYLTEDPYLYWSIGYGTYSTDTEIVSVSLHASAENGNYPIHDLVLTGLFKKDLNIFKDCEFEHTLQYWSAEENRVITAYATGTITIDIGSSF